MTIQYINPCNGARVSTNNGTRFFAVGGPVGAKCFIVVLNQLKILLNSTVV